MRETPPASDRRGDVVPDRGRNLTHLAVRGAPSSPSVERGQGNGRCSRRAGPGGAAAPVGVMLWLTEPHYPGGVLESSAPRSSSPRQPADEELRLGHSIMHMARPTQPHLPVAERIPPWTSLSNGRGSSAAARSRRWTSSTDSGESGREEAQGRKASDRAALRACPRNPLPASRESKHLMPPRHVIPSRFAEAAPAAVVACTGPHQRGSPASRDGALGLSPVS